MAARDRPLRADTGVRRFYWIVGTKGWSFGRRPLIRREGPSEFRLVIGFYREDQA